MCFWGNCPNFGPNTGFWDHNFKKKNFEFESQSIYIVSWGKMVELFKNFVVNKI